MRRGLLMVVFSGFMLAPPSWAFAQDSTGARLVTRSDVATVR